MPYPSEWEIEFSSGIPVYKQIENLVYAAIGDGALAEGDRLPTIKELARRFQVNPNTVAKAYRELDIKGVITSRRGDGSYLSATTGEPAGTTAQQKRARLDAMLGRIIAEARATDISEEEIFNHIKERMEAHE